MDCTRAHMCCTCTVQHQGQLSGAGVVQLAGMLQAECGATRPGCLHQASCASFVGQLWACSARHCNAAGFSTACGLVVSPTNLHAHDDTPHHHPDSSCTPCHCCTTPLSPSHITHMHPSLPRLLTCPPTIPHIRSCPACCPQA